MKPDNKTTNDTNNNNNATSINNMYTTNKSSDHNISNTCEGPRGSRAKLSARSRAVTSILRAVDII